MESKIISLHVRDERMRDQYLSRLRELSLELQAIAEEFGESPRAALADLTYIVVGDDIMMTIQSLDMPN